MHSIKFLVSGTDKKLLAGIKNSLTSDGHIFMGYSSEPLNILRHVRSLNPELLVIETVNEFSRFRPVLEVLDEELVSACILILNSRNDEIFDFLQKTRTVMHMIKPVTHELLLQAVDLTVTGFKRVKDYETRLRRLNETRESRSIVKKAKWILVEQNGITESEAFELIRKKSRDNRTPMRDIAEAIIITRG